MDRGSYSWETRDVTVLKINEASYLRHMITPTTIHYLLMQTFSLLDPIPFGGKKSLLGKILAH